MAFYTLSRANPTDNLPLVGDGTVYEAKVAGEEKVYLVDHRRMWAWANWETEKIIREKKRRRR
jgi:hypothetical protein